MKTLTELRIGVRKKMSLITISESDWLGCISIFQPEEVRNEKFIVEEVQIRRCNNLRTFEFDDDVENLGFTHCTLLQTIRPNQTIYQR